MTAYYFAKLHISVLDDPTWGKLPDYLWRRRAELLLLAKEHNRDGLLQPVPDMAWRLRIDEDRLVENLQALAEFGVTEKTERGWVLVSYADTQSALSNAERQALYRQRQRNEKRNDEVTHGVTKRNTDIEEEVRGKRKNHNNSADGDFLGDLAKITEEVENEPEKPYAHLSAAFVSASGVPEPSFGGKGWGDWEDGLRRLSEMKATKHEIVRAVKKLDELGYSYGSPNSLVVTISKLRKKKEKPGDNGHLPGLTGEDLDRALEEVGKA
jgi:hypothetical protein